jgi:DNA-binding NarL/FixJ family response regulator
LLIVDDHEVMRTGVKGLLSTTPEWEVCGEAKDGLEGVQKFQQLSPDVVLLDLNMPLMSGFEAAAKIREIAPQAKVVFFSIHEFASAGRLVNANGFVSKRTVAHDLLSVLEGVVGRPASD